MAVEEAEWKPTTPETLTAIPLSALVDAFQEKQIETGRQIKGALYQTEAFQAHMQIAKAAREPFSRNMPCLQRHTF